MRPLRIEMASMHTVLASLSGLSNDDIRTIGAVATCVGVLIALLGPAYKRWWRAPLLSLDYDPREGDPHWDHVSMPGGSFFLRVRATNARKCDAAKDVEIMVAGFRSGILGLDERSLEWSGQRPSRGSPAVTSLDLAPGVSRHVDVIQISPPSGSHAVSTRYKPRDQEQARLCVFPKPWGKAHVVGYGSAQDLRLLVTAANADAVTYTTSLSYTGDGTAMLLSPLQATDRPAWQRVRHWLKRS